MTIFNNEITFIHIPKSGGTTIEKFLQRFENINNYFEIIKNKIGVKTLIYNI